MSNRNCENFRESINMNWDPSRENVDKEKAYENNIEAWTKYIVKKPIKFNNGDRDPIGSDR